MNSDQKWKECLKDIFIIDTYTIIARLRGVF